MGSGTHNFLPSSTLAAETLELSLGIGTVQGTLEVSQSILCNGCNWTFAANADVLDYGNEVTISPGGLLRFDAPTDRPVDFDSVTIGPSTSGGNTFDANTGQPFNIKTLTMNNNAHRPHRPARFLSVPSLLPGRDAAACRSLRRNH